MRYCYHDEPGFYLWVTSKSPNVRLRTLGEKPLSEKDATVIASKWNASARVVVRPASYRHGCQYCDDDVKEFDDLILGND